MENEGEVEEMSFINDGESSNHHFLSRMKKKRMRISIHHLNEEYSTFMKKKL